MAQALVHAGLVFVASLALGCGNSAAESDASEADPAMSPEDVASNAETSVQPESPSEAAGGNGAGGAPAQPASNPTPPAGPPPAATEVQGWASVPGLGVETTTGGEGGEVVTPTTAEELLEYAAAEEPLTIEISGVFDVPRLQINSNKTLVGSAGGATINGGLRIRGSRDAFVQNVIVRNLRVNGATSEVEGDVGQDNDDDDAVMIYYAHHVWVDHCEIWDGRDGSLDVVHGSDFVTVSWTKFRYSDAPPYPDHRFATLIGHSDSANAAAEDEGALSVTLHHNWWAENVIERMPRVRFGRVHVVNNYYSSVGANYGVRAAYHSTVLIEGNAFDGLKDPHIISDDEGAPAQVLARNNVYVATSGAQDQTGMAFEPPYAMTIDDPNSIKELVMAGAGPQ